MCSGDTAAPRCPVGGLKGAIGCDGLSACGPAPAWPMVQEHSIPTPVCGTGSVGFKLICREMVPSRALGSGHQSRGGVELHPAHDGVTCW